MTNDPSGQTTAPDGQLSLLSPTAFRALPLGAIQPGGWLVEQLHLQATGLTGQLEEIWADVGPNSGWKGGDGEAWERGPYYLDGLVPLAHLTDDPGLQRKVARWVDAMVASARDDGQFGPATEQQTGAAGRRTSSDDWWPRMIALKALMQQYEATADTRILDLIERYLRYQATWLPRTPLTDWGRVRGADNVLVVYWLYERNGDPALLDLADSLLAQTADWGTWLAQMPAKDITRTWDHMTHVVNVAMGLKTPALRYLRDGDANHRRQLDQGLANLDHYHGQVHGFFSGDEWLAGTDARRGTELCAVVEAMFSFEQLVRIYGDAAYGDRLENLAYNLLPATLDAKMTVHQYHQQANQVLATIAQRDWTQAGDDCTIFGLEPNFGCCTANLHQGWPKLVSSMWMATADGQGLAAIVHGPSRVDTSVGGKPVSVDVTTDYPFDEVIRYHISVSGPTDLVLAMRIPAWCREPSLAINGTSVAVSAHPAGEAGFLRTDRTWQDGDEVELRLPMPVQAQERPSGGVGISLGPLRMAASPGEVWTRLPDSPSLGDYEVRPRRSWNVALAVDPATVNDIAKVERLGVQSPPWGLTTGSPPFGFEGVAVKVWLPGRRVGGWRLVEDDVPPPPAIETGTAEPDMYRPLVPYGSTRLRIAEFPNAAPSPMGRRGIDQAPE